MEPTDTCSAVARAVHEPLAGTAPEALGWIAIEVAGAWGRDGLTDASLDPSLTDALVRATADVPVRVQLIRRPRGHGRGDAERRMVVLAHAGATPWCEVAHLDDDGLAALDPRVCMAPTPPGIGRRHERPLFLVCTHARRDRCCATLGRPVADTLSALHPDEVWETSHTGGHRFAANVVVLPHGLVYGGLDVADAVETIAHHLAGRVDARHLRGRSSLDRPSQAAEALVRQALELDGFDAVRVIEVVGRDTSTMHARVATPTGTASVELVRAPLGTPRRISCDADEPDDPAAFHLVSVTHDVAS